MQFNLIIPMAGNGQRFYDAGYKDPKPFIDVLGKPMIVRVIDNFSELWENISQIVLICKPRHVERLNEILLSEYGNEGMSKFCVTAISTKDGTGVTEGAACTVAQGIRCGIFDESLPIMVANSDQIVNADLVDFWLNSRRNSILLFEETEGSEKWSYALIDPRFRNVVKVAEKSRISDYATVGIYSFASGEEFLKSMAQMVAHNDRVNNEFYLCPVYNYIRGPIGYKIINQNQMHGLGTPADLERYIEKESEK